MSVLKVLLPPKVGARKKAAPLQVERESVMDSVHAALASYSAQLLGRSATIPPNSGHTTYFTTPTAPENASNAAAVQALVALVTERLGKAIHVRFEIKGQRVSRTRVCVAVLLFAHHLGCVNSAALPILRECGSRTQLWSRDICDRVAMMLGPEVRQAFAEAVRKVEGSGAWDFYGEVCREMGSGGGVELLRPTACFDVNVAVTLAKEPKTEAREFLRSVAPRGQSRGTEPADRGAAEAGGKETSSGVDMAKLRQEAAQSPEFLAARKRRRSALLAKIAEDDARKRKARWRAPDLCASEVAAAEALGVAVADLQDEGALLFLQQTAIRAYDPPSRYRPRKRRPLPDAQNAVPAKPGPGKEQAQALDQGGADLGIAPPRGS